MPCPEPSGAAMRRREFITLLGGAAARGRSRRARSSASGCGASACSCPAPPTTPNIRPASRRSCRGCSNWAGATAATCGSTPAGPQAMPTIFANTRRNWSRSRRTSSWPLAATTVGPLLQATRTVPIVFPIIVDPVGAGFVDSLARPGGNATGFITFEYGLEREMAGAAQADRARRDASGGPSGSRHSRRDRPVCRNPVRGAVARGGGDARSTCATPARSSAPSRPSRALRMAA